MRLLHSAALLLPLLTGVQCFAPSDDTEAKSVDAASETSVATDAKPDDLPAMLTAACARNADVAENATFKEALRLLRDGQHSAAVRAFDQTARSAPGVAD